MHRKRQRYTVVAFLVVAICLPAAWAESAEEPQEKAQPEEESERNEMGLFVGLTAGGAAEDGGENEATGTIGVDYRRRFSRRIGVGVQVEVVGGQRRDYVGLVPLTIWLSSKAELIVGVGWEGSSGTDIFGGESKPLGRLGFGYSIKLLPRNSIRPEINVDFVDGETLVVVGASIGWEF